MEIKVVEAWDLEGLCYRGRGGWDFGDWWEVVKVDRWSGGIDSGDVLGGRAGYILGCGGGSTCVWIVKDKDCDVERRVMFEYELAKLDHGD